MPVRIVNHFRSLLTISLNSGASIHLAPDEASSPIEKLEVDNNSSVEELLKRRWISMEHSKDEAPADTVARLAEEGQSIK